LDAEEWGHGGKPCLLGIIGWLEGIGAAKAEEKAGAHADDWSELQSFVASGAA
jgi:hypothetical protein